MRIEAKNRADLAALFGRDRRRRLLCKFYRRFKDSYFGDPELLCEGKDKGGNDSSNQTECGIVNLGSSHQMEDEKHGNNKGCQKTKSDAKVVPPTHIAPAIQHTCRLWLKESVTTTASVSKTM